MHPPIQFHSSRQLSPISVAQKVNQLPYHVQETANFFNFIFVKFSCQNIQQTLPGEPLFGVFKLDQFWNIFGTIFITRQLIV